MSYITIEHGIPYAVDSLWTLTPDRLTIINRSWEHCQAFDADSRYELVVSDVPQFSRLQRLLAHTVYNPSVELTATWTRVGDRSPSDLLNSVRAGLAKDDDIITQWFNGNEVIKLLESASSWDELVLAVRCIGGEHETNRTASAYVRKILGLNRI
ncbi:MAG: hypothetical protein KDA74_03265 [Planctomycetaceae bacterium]|nr:hypothetical protein [Planctomycetaceae bacterium]